MDKPVIPSTCTVLSAQLAAVNNQLPDDAESHLDTARLRAALDHCKPGLAVELKLDGAKNAFLSGPLQLRSGVTLRIDHGVTLYASRNPRLYDLTPGICGTLSAHGHGCKPLLSIDNASNAAIMGDGVIDGQGGGKVLGYDYTWWQLARTAEHAGKLQNCPRLVVANHADGLILYRISLHNSPNFHVAVNNTNGLTVWGIHILTPTVRGTDARNTDGVDPGSSTNITVAHSWIDNGDDNIAIKTGVTHMSVFDDHFYDGHGMSIGSETYSGVSNLLVDGITEDHTTSGIRIKSNATRGGLVHDLTYRNICMRNVPVPIAISPFYNNQTIEGFVDPGIQGNRIPEYKRIRLENIDDLTPGDVLIAGKDADHITDILLNNVTIHGIKPSEVHMQFAKVELGKGGANFQPAGKSVTVEHVDVANMGSVGKTCAGRFVPMQ
ncbi:MAG: glycoside hydrolase family 28 protein [Acidobacteriaceae bacterium]